MTFLETFPNSFFKYLFLLFPWFHWQLFWRSVHFHNQLWRSPRNEKFLFTHHFTLFYSRKHEQFNKYMSNLTIQHRYVSIVTQTILYWISKHALFKNERMCNFFEFMNNEQGKISLSFMNNFRGKIASENTEKFHWFNGLSNTSESRRSSKVILLQSSPNYMAVHPDENTYLMN